MTMQRDPTPELLELIAARFRAMGDPARVGLLGILRGGERTVSELTSLCGFPQPSVSKHLRQLCAHGFVARRRDGQFVYYRLANRDAFKLCDLMCARLRTELGVGQPSDLTRHAGAPLTRGSAPRRPFRARRSPKAAAR